MTAGLVLTHSSLRKSKVLDFSVGNWEKVLLLFTRLPGALYFMFDGGSGFFMAGELEEELNSLLKLQMVKSRGAAGVSWGGELGEKKSAGKEQGMGSPTHHTVKEARNHHSMSEREACWEL